jgi:hypothetical protein
MQSLIKLSIHLLYLYVELLHSILLYHLVFGKLTHLKSLELIECSFMYEPDFLINIHEIIPSLETLIMETDLPLIMPMDINYLIQVLDSIGNVKNLYICGFQYQLNNKEFRRLRQIDFNEDQTRVVFERAMDVINKKFPISWTDIKIVDNEYGWRIKKEGGKPGKLPSMIKKPFKCTFIDDSDRPGPKLTCIKMFTEKAKLEEHMKHRYAHWYPDYLL